MNNKKSLFSLALLAGVVSFASCSDDVMNDNNTGAETRSAATTQQSDIVVLDSGTVSWHDHYSRMLAEIQREKDAANGEEEVAPQTLALEAFAKEGLEKSDSIAAAEAGTNGEYNKVEKTKMLSIYNYKWVSILYQSVDEHQNPITLSTLLAYPRHWSKTVSPRNLVIGCHITITQDAQCPTNYSHQGMLTDVGMIVTHASNSSTDACYGNLVVMPDYEGYGISANRAHPYLYQELTARQVVDGAKAALKWFEENETKMQDGWGTMSVGYSQGGSVSMAVQRYIEQKNLSEFNFKGSICGDGPYDPVATLKDYIATNKVFMPVALGLIIKGMCDANPIITKAGYKAEDFFTQKFLESGIIDMISAKALNTDQIQEKLAEASLNGKNCTAHLLGRTRYWIFGKYDYRDYTRGNYKKYTWRKVKANEAVYWNTSDLIRPEVFAYLKGDTEGRTAEGDARGKALEQALEMNNLTTNWVPAHPIVVFHSTKDEVVKFANYESARDKFANASQWFKGIKYENRGTYTHVGTGTAFFPVPRYEGRYSRWILNSNTDWNSIPTEQVEKGSKALGW